MDIFELIIQGLIFAISVVVLTYDIFYRIETLRVKKRLGIHLPKVIQRMLTLNYFFSIVAVIFSAYIFFTHLLKLL